MKVKDLESVISENNSVKTKARYLIKKHRLDLLLDKDFQLLLQLIIEITLSSDSISFQKLDKIISLSTNR